MIQGGELKEGDKLPSQNVSISLKAWCMLVLVVGSMAYLLEVVLVKITDRVPHFFLLKQAWGGSGRWIFQRI
jgi:hypothetical protein